MSKAKELLEAAALDLFQKTDGKRKRAEKLLVLIPETLLRIEEISKGVRKDVKDKSFIRLKKDLTTIAKLSDLILKELDKK